jgi:hypothetical protein
MLVPEQTPRHSLEVAFLAIVAVERVFAADVPATRLGQPAADDVADRDCSDERPGAHVVERVGYPGGDQDRHVDGDHREELRGLERILGLVAMRVTSLAVRRCHAMPFGGFCCCHALPPLWSNYQRN